MPTGLQDSPSWNSINPNYTTQYSPPMFPVFPFFFFSRMWCFQYCLFVDFQVCCQEISKNLLTDFSDTLWIFNNWNSFCANNPALECFLITIVISKDISGYFAVSRCASLQHLLLMPLLEKVKFFCKSSPSKEVDCKIFIFLLCFMVSFHLTKSILFLSFNKTE